MEQSNIQFLDLLLIESDWLSRTGRVVSTVRYRPKYSGSIPILDIRSSRVGVKTDVFSRSHVMIVQATRRLPGELPEIRLIKHQGPAEWRIVYCTHSLPCCHSSGLLALTGDWSVSRSTLLPQLWAARSHRRLECEQGEGGGPAEWRIMYCTHSLPCCHSSGLLALTGDWSVSRSTLLPQLWAARSHRRLECEQGGGGEMGEPAEWKIVYCTHSLPCCHSSGLLALTGDWSVSRVRGEGGTSRVEDRVLYSQSTLLSQLWAARSHRRLECEQGGGGGGNQPSGGSCTVPIVYPAATALGCSLSPATGVAARGEALEPITRSFCFASSTDVTESENEKNRCKTKHSAQLLFFRCQASSLGCSDAQLRTERRFSTRTKNSSLTKQQSLKHSMAPDNDDWRNLIVSRVRGCRKENSVYPRQTASIPDKQRLSQTNSVYPRQTASIPDKQRLSQTNSVYPRQTASIPDKQRLSQTRSL
ncbi:hypothetical protein RRG08_019234 [Elysia crispata]|uniref:Uncharacterized protein n=1 Tax=Elysia crispata TaxID=231223 RepID=A0AAE1AUH8_9GAST|nr:hypothetical protein RRG08_019234 [Elysia crispata]